MGEPRAIWVIRHGEKPENGLLGVDDTGRPNEHSLIPRGWQRAGALTKIFTRSPAPGTPHLSTPDRLWCPTYGGTAHTEERRPYQTLLPLSGRSDQKIEANFQKGDEPKLAGALLKLSVDSVLVCWEHTHIPAIARALPTNADTPPPDTWPGDRYDLIWQFHRDGDSYRFTQIAQHALGGDQPV